jgi:hypothetical protein
MSRDQDSDIFQKRIVEILTEVRESIGRGDLGLEEAISRASDGKATIDRRRLSDMIEGKNIRLSFAELYALDIFLSQQGRGSLKDLFENSTILRALVDTKEKMLYLIGTRQANYTTTMARYDVRAIADFNQSLSRISSDIRFDIVDVLRRDTPVQSDTVDPDALFGQEEWYKHLQNTSSNLICIASPRANPAAEMMLATMFDVPPFSPPSNKDEIKTPFSFIWSDTNALPSTFACPSLTPSGLSDREQRWGTYGMVINNETNLISRKLSVWDEYGIFAMQVRKTGQIWLVLSGLTGSATYGSTKFVAKFAGEMPALRHARHSPVLWGAVKVSIRYDEECKGDGREVIDYQMYGRPYIWPET